MFNSEQTLAKMCGNLSRKETFIPVNEMQRERRAMPSETERITHGFMDRLMDAGKLEAGPERGYTEEGERSGEEETAPLTVKRKRTEPAARAD
jgi:hypothetical protein